MGRTGTSSTRDANFSNATLYNASFAGANAASAIFSGAGINGGTNFSDANLNKANFVGEGADPSVGGALCNDETAFNSASVAYVLLLEISIEGSFPLYFPVITIDLVPGWNVNGQCCFPVKGGIRIGC